MEIKRGRYILRSDKWCYWIDMEYESKDKKTGKVKHLTKNVSGYYADFSQLANGLANHIIGESEAKSMKKLIEDVRAYKEMISRMTYSKVKEISND